MNVPYRWLQEYVATRTDPVTLGEKFRMTSSEAEGVSQGFEFVPELVSGHVLELIQHPNADRLRVATVDTGEKKPRTIVCGAPNIAEGQYVIVAKPGAVITHLNGSSITISESPLRGVVSQGMICGADEIGINASFDGIIVLDGPVAPGTPAAKALQLDDSVIDLEITPNRPDLLSLFGLAREVAAFERLRLIDTPIASVERDTAGTLRIDARIDDSRLASRYSALALSVDGSAQSPWWLQARLILAGIKPISAVVDVTNYVMMELGQPLHAFDLDKLPQPKRRGGPLLCVRGGEKGERLAALDGSTRTLEEGDIVIADAENTPVALAGIMGGASSMITSETTRVLLEAATFSGGHIRRTSRRLGLRTEASSRFEKGLDPELTITALKRAAYLLKEIAGAQVISGIDDVSKRASVERPRIHLTFTRIQQVLGVHINAAECKAILLKLGFQLPSFTKAGFEAVPPTWRSDVKLQEDVIEEIVRIWGYERIPLTLPSGPVVAPQPNPRFKAKSAIRRSLASSGAYEMVSQPFVSARQLEKAKFSLDYCLKLPNPLSKEGEYLLPNHLVSFLENIGEVNREAVPVALFEIGSVFMAPHKEVEELSLILRAHEATDALVRQAKGMIEGALKQAGLHSNLSYVPMAESHPSLNAATHTSIYHGKTLVGGMAFVASDVVASHKIRSGRALLYLNFNLDELLSLPKDDGFYVPDAKFPGSDRDITIVVDRTLPFSSVAEAVEADRSPHLKEWKLTTSFTGKPLDDSKKSLTLRFSYNAGDRTLTDDEVKADQDKIVSRLTTTLKATL